MVHIKNFCNKKKILLYFLGWVVGSWIFKIYIYVIYYIVSHVSLPWWWFRQ